MLPLCSILISPYLTPDFHAQSYWSTVYLNFTSGLCELRDVRFLEVTATLSIELWRRRLVWRSPTRRSQVLKSVSETLIYDNSSGWCWGMTIPLPTPALLSRSPLCIVKVFDTSAGLLLTITSLVITTHQQCKQLIKQKLGIADKSNNWPYPENKQT